MARLDLRWLARLFRGKAAKGPARRGPRPGLERLEDRTAPAVFSNTAAITIPGSGAASPYPSGITVSGLSGAVTDVKVTLHGFEHESSYDVDAMLVGPTGARVVLLSDAGAFGAVSNLNLTFADGASAGLSGGPLTSGTYKPTDLDAATDDAFPAPAPPAAGASPTLAAAFNGTAPNGTWQLFVIDELGSYSGSIAGGWSLDILVSPPPNLAAVAHAFSHSREYYTHFVVGAYDRFLGRAPDAPGLTAWVDAMQLGGLSDERLEAGFIGSPEYIANHGGSHRAWVVGMYHDLLGRAPGEAEVGAWEAALAAGASPVQVAYGFAASAEREGLRVADNYLTYLGRAPSRSEVDAWVAAFVRGVSSEDMVAGFVGSTEYFNRPGKGGGSAEAWVRSAYLDVLFRAASDAEVQGWLRVLG
jgi:hypothetical protein